MNKTATATEFTHRWVQGASPYTLLLLHGTGGDENDLLGLGRIISPDASQLSPRGKALERGMPRFFRRLAEGVFDLEDLHGRTQELADWIDTAARQYGFDKSKLVAVGYSNGANIAASLLLSRPESLAHAILLRAMLPFEPAVMPDLSAKRILMENGKRDTVIPAASSARLFEVLEAAGADVTFRLNGGGHGIDPAELEEARDWFQAL